MCKEFINRLEKFKEEFVKISLLASFTDTTYAIMQLSIQQGGIGMLNYKSVAHSAFTASLLQFANNPPNFGYNIVTSAMQPNPDTDRPHILEFRRSLQFLEINDQQSFDDLLTQTRNQQSVQHFLTCRAEDRRMQTIMGNLYPHQTAWLINLQNEHAGKWLEAIPKNIKFTFSPQDFRVLLKYRYMLQIAPSMAGCPCRCTASSCWDAYGHHIATGCRLQGTRIGTHDNIVYELNSLLRYAGFRTKIEERNCFSATLVPGPNGNVDVDPDPPEKRPDISVLNPKSTIVPKIVIDVSVTSPLAGAESGVFKPLSLEQANIAGRMARDRVKDKIKKYKDLLTLDGGMVPLSPTTFQPTPQRHTNYGFQFLPFVMESTGFINPSAVNFINFIAREAAVIHKLKPAIATNYFFKCISVSLAKGIASAINSRLLTLSNNLPPLANLLE
jgi:hypothetical protein